ncbi:MAG: hypothetical protein CVU22_00310 [Betaproteobacteria bacterium HGW-Betaproteobacteria-16]|nr:MAG: hypothetical protein CVU22_00310 [Betaproteobacteria bacterium HGW-Betaproteobacteria-16]
MSPTPVFRNDIQGLRAVAVMAVILNHLGLPWFAGGFIGVDIFFVISGFLITLQLKREFHQTNNISLLNFYIRRFRRLFPAAIATCMLTLVMAYLVSSQEKLELLADSALAALVGAANIYFWIQVGYFDAEAYDKPLLHMWSLGVEEQFYLFWPLLLLLGFKFLSKTALLWGFLVLGFASFLLNYYWFDTSLPEHFNSYSDWRQKLGNPAESTFYLMPFRIFEFCIGAMVAFRPLATAPSALPTNLRTGLSLFAAAFLIYAILRFDASVVFPYWNALAVATATGMIIHLGSGSLLLERLLANRPMVSLGTISYSLYLIHWPVIVFYRDLNGPLDLPDMGLALMLIGLMAFALYTWVETPARYSVQENKAPKVIWRHPALIALTALLCTAFMSFTLPTVEGRVPERRKALSNAEWRELESKKFCQQPIEGLPSQLFRCQLNRNAKQTIIIWGDSHARHLIGGFAQNFPEFNIALSYTSACAHQNGFGNYVRDSKARTQSCIEHNLGVLNWLQSSPRNFIVFLSSAKRDRPERMSSINNEIISLLRSAGHDAWVLGDYIRPGRPLATCRSVPDFLISDEQTTRVCQPDLSVVAAEIKYATAMSKLNEYYVPLHDVQCPSVDRCRFTDFEFSTTFYDTHHLTYKGSTFEIREAMPLLMRNVPSLRDQTTVPIANIPPVFNR